MKEVSIYEFHKLSKEEKEAIKLWVMSEQLSNFLNRREPNKWHIVQIKSS